MASPSPQAVALIRDKVKDWSQTDAAIVAELNEPAATNPTPCPTVPRRFGLSEIVAACPQADRSKLVGFLPIAAPLIVTQDRASLAGGLNGLVLLGSIPQTTADLIVAAINQTDPDPAYRPKISWAESTIGRLLDLQDIQAVRPTT